MTKATDPRRLLRALRVEAELPVPPALDRRVRRLLRARAGETPRLLRPGLATGYALAGCMALLAALSIGFAEAGAAEEGPALALLALLAYLAVSVAASAPILLIGRRRAAAVGGSSR